MVVVLTKNGEMNINEMAQGSGISSSSIKQYMVYPLAVAKKTQDVILKQFPELLNIPREEDVKAVRERDHRLSVEYNIRRMGGIKMLTTDSLEQIESMLRELHSKLWPSMRKERTPHV
jgi:hypothetical protein